MSRKKPRISQIATINAFVAASAPANEQAGVTGNSLHGYGRGPLAEVAITGSCRFSDNHCSEVDEKVAIAVSLDANTIVAANNRVESARNTRSLNLTVASKTGFTVLGNIVGGSIVVNNVALDAPMVSVLFEMTEKRLGAAGVVDRRGRLRGVVTDGDLRRALARYGDLRDRPAQQVMSPDPKRIAADASTTFDCAERLKLVSYALT